MHHSPSRFAVAAAVLTIVTFSGCGGGDSGTNPGPGPGNSADGDMTAKVNGQSWTGGDLAVYATGVPGVPGGLGIGGTQTISGASVRSITLTLYNIHGPGTYPLGVVPPVFGGFASFSDASGVWMTGNTGTAGTITFTTLSTTRVAGTFQFTAIPVAGGGGVGTKEITDGAFDLPLTGTIVQLRDQDGASLTATLNGSPYVASTIAVTMKGAAGFGVSSLTGTQTVTIWLNGATTPGTYSPTLEGNLRGISVTDLTTGSGSNHPNWGLTAEDAGTITITSLTPTRVKGTFNVTLGPQPTGGASGNMVAVGMFDVGTP
jgi:hypothetical protein